MNVLLHRSPKGIYGSIVGSAATAARNQSIRSNTSTGRLWTYTSRKCNVDKLVHHPAQRPFYRQTTVLPALSSPIIWPGNDLYFGAPSSMLYAIPAAGQSSVNSVRYFSLSASRFEASSKVEETVKKIQEKEKEKDLPKKTDLAMTPAKIVVKKSIKQKIWDEVLHYYHGFRLLFIDINVARKLLGKVLSGKTLTRREYMLLIRTTGDVFRLVPFSVFIIVPFMELLLPVFIKLFPGMLPSTFETAKDMEDKARKNLKVKLEMAKFLQKTLDEMDVTSKDHKSEEAKEFIEFFNKLRTAGERATPEEIMKFSRLFEDEITLDSLSHQQLSAICKVLEVPSLGTSNLLRFQLRMKLRNLAADDRMIQKEGVDTLTLSELQAASRSRGMRSYGLSLDQLKHQLLEWINLSLNEKVPPSLLLLSRAMLLPEDVPTSEKLKASISVLSDAAAMQTKAAIGEREGKIDNKTKIDVIRDEQRKIKEELEELKEVQQEKGPEAIVDTLVDNAKTILADSPSVPVLETPTPAAATQPQPTVVVASATTEASQFSSKDIETMSNALDAIAAEKKTLLVEKEEIKDLKEEIADYKEDVEELRIVSEQSDSGAAIKQSSASKMLLKKVDKMINNLDKVLADLEAKEAKLQADIEKVSGGAIDSKKSELVRVDELIFAIRRMQKIPDESKMDLITKMLDKIDSDKDGQLKVDDVLKIIEAIGKDSVNLSEKQLDELIDLISKEEYLENEDKIEKALAKSLETRVNKSDAAAATGGDVKTDETLVDTAKVLSDSEPSSQKVTDESSAKLKNVSKIDERINTEVIRSATDAAERQKDKILPLASDIPKTPQLPNPSSTTVTNTKDKML